MSSGALPSPVRPACGSNRVSEPSLPIAKLEIELLPVLVSYAYLPFFEITTQQAAVWVVPTDGLITFTFLSFKLYEDIALASAAPPKASETIKCPDGSKAKPKGVTPAESFVRGGPAIPRRTLYTSMRF